MPFRKAAAGSNAEHGKSAASKFGETATLAGALTGIVREKRRLRALCGLCVLCGTLFDIACGGTRLFRQYEYEEDVYLSLDGTATVYVNASVPVLNALHGTSFDARPTARVDRDAVRAYYSSPATHVAWVRSSRRNNRRFVHVRLEVDDIRRLSAAAPFSWSAYQFYQDGDRYIFKQAIGTRPGAAAGRGPDEGRRDAGAAGSWSGRELVAFRLHLPSKIEDNNSGGDVRRGNILVWEQTLADRLRGAPVDIEARMQTQSILYTTLWLFAATFVAVAIAFLFVIWWILKRAPARVESGSVPRERTHAS
jgi:hypothetical protein